MTIPTKNEIPWTGIMKAPIKLTEELLSVMKSIWDRQNWGENYENNRRPPNQIAIYPATRVVRYLPNVTNDHEWKDILDYLITNLQPHFVEEITYWQSELVLFVPNGYVPFHVDTLALCERSWRIIIPLTEQQDFSYYFCSWKEDTPTDDPKFIAPAYVGDDVYEVKMEYGNAYYFNHRVPHKTVSKSPLPRATFSFDIIPIRYMQDFKSSDSGVIDSTKNIPIGITEFEKTKILPPIL